MTEKINIIKNEKIKCFADPYIIKSGGNYYIYSTHGEGVVVSKSTDLSNFECQGFCLQVQGQKEFWAPCVIEHDNKFYMYYSSINYNSNDVHEQQIKLAVSDYPDRDFKFVKDLCQPFSIDPHVVKNANGEFFMFYSINDYDADRAGTLIVVDKMNNLSKMCGEPNIVVRPTLDEEIFQKDRFKKGQHWHTLEGAFYIYEDGYHYLMYSGNCYENENYYIGYAVSKGNGSDDLTKLNFVKYPDSNTYSPLLSKNEYIEGTGHNSAIKLNEDWYMIHHARELKNERKPLDTRLAFKTAIKLGNGKIVKI